MLLLLAAVASAAARGGAIPVLACAETQVLALSSPAIELCFCFRIGFAVIYSKKVCQPAAAVQKHVELCISHLFVRCFPVCVAFRIGFYSIFADSRLSAHAGFDLHLSFSSVWGWGMGGGGDDVHANATCVFCFSCCFLCVSHFASVFAVFLPTLDFLHMPA